ncbi:MAG TPA: hypothetical protein V6C95_17440 [Coleofasciculaceae cyanobacterium]
MWILNVILIFGAIAFLSWFFGNYGGDISTAFGVLFSGLQSVLFALAYLLFAAVKAIVISAVVGAVFGLIFFVAGAPKQVPQTVAMSIASLTFALLVLKAMWENANNLRWSIRNEIRNRYRRW